MTTEKLIAICIIIFSVYGIWEFFSSFIYPVVYDIKIKQCSPAMLACIAILIVLVVFFFKGKTNDKTNSDN